MSPISSMEPPLTEAGFIAAPRVCVLLLNWDGWPDTMRCLQSLQGLDYPCWYPLVVDNGSSDDSVERLRAAFPNVPIIETKRNLGYGGGCDVGLRAALAGDADFVWLLNNDTLVDPRALTALVGVAAQDRRIGAVGSVIYDMERPSQVQTWGGGQVFMGLGIAYPHRRPVTARRLHYITGASLLLRRRALDDVGLLDEKRFFLYWEDTDLGFRLRKQGWQLAVAGDSHVWHRQSASLGQSSAVKDAYVAASAVRFFRKHAPVPALPILAGSTARVMRRACRGEWTRVGGVLRGALEGLNDLPQQPPLSRAAANRPLRIAVEASTLLAPQTGIRRYAEGLSCALAGNTGIEVTHFFGVRWQRGMPQPASPKALRAARRLQDLVPWGRRLQFALQSTAFRYHARRDRPDVVFAPNPLAPLSNIPTAITVHDLSHLHYPEAHAPARTRFLREQLPKALARATAVFTGSLFSADEIGALFPAANHKLRVIHPGVDARFFASDRDDGQKKVKNPLPGSIPHPYFLFLASPEPRKNLPRLLRAYATLPRKVRRAHPLYLAGRLAGHLGWGQAEFAGDLKTLLTRGEARLLGEVPDNLLPGLYRNALALLHPSLYESFALPPLEAMASGCPVLVSDTSAMPEVCGDTAVYSDPLDVESIREGMLRLAEDSALREDLARRGPHRAALYSWERTGEELLAGLRDAAGH